MIKNNINKVLIIGLFLNLQDGALPTQAEELSLLLIRSNYISIKVSKFKNKFLRVLETVYKIFYYSRNYSTAIVQFYGGLSLILEGLSTIILKLLGKKVIITIHGGYVPEQITKNPKIYLYILKKADIITCPSSYMSERLKEFGLKTIQVENIIFTDSYVYTTKSEFRPKIFWMRAFHPIYNPLMMVEVIRILKLEYPEIECIMGGTKNKYMNTVLDKIKEYGLENNIKLPGFVNIDDKNKYANQCDIYACTNIIDNAPVTFLEMMALGLPIVSANVGGVSYLVKDNETALLVPTNDANMMAIKIKELISNPSLGVNLRNNGIELLKKFSEKEILIKWLNILNKN